MKIRRRKCPALVGLSEAAEILGMKRNNLHRLHDLPEPLQDRGIEGFAVKAGPLWPRVEIEELAENRASRANSRTPAKSQARA